LSWLADYVDLPESLDDLVHRLTMSGTEVEDVVVVGESWQDVTVAEVLSLDRPEGSQHLSVARLSTGTSDLTAVTGAPNIEVGQKVPIVRLGGLIPHGPDGEPFVLQPREMMGITGEAMVLSERELGLSEEHSGILVLPSETTVGTPLTDVMGDSILDVDAKGRTDELSVLGIAREIAAVTGVELRQPDSSQPQTVRIENVPSVAVEVLAPDLCPRYSALRVDGIHVSPSPSWLILRLESAGVRAINNVVDVTNFVMLETGQPLHAFDFNMIPEGRIIVRRSLPAETIMTLDGVERTLLPDTLVIADPEGPTGIGGIMGGGKSEVTDSTQSILIEAANFDRVNIRASARHLGLRTEASARFERGVPPELTAIAIARCVRLLAEGGQGIVVHQLVDVRGDLPPLPSMTFTPADIERLLGIAVPREDILAALDRLGFDTQTSGDAMTVVAPYWRRDVEGTADIAEEVARMMGYDAIPETLPGQETQPAPLPPELAWENAVRETLWGISLTEAWTDTLTSPEALARLLPSGSSDAPDWSSVIANPAGLSRHGAGADVMMLVNAPTTQRCALRISLLPHLLDVAARNLKHTHERIAFFEAARTFFPRLDDLPYERRTLGIVLTEDREVRTWNRPAITFDFFDLKGIIVAVLNRLNLDDSGPDHGFQIVPPDAGQQRGHLHPGRQARIIVGGSDAGFLGELHPLVAERFDIESPIRAYVAELDLDVLFAHARRKITLLPVPRFPTVKRDISVSFPANMPASAVEILVRDSGGTMLRGSRIVDLYQGSELGPGRRSIALFLEFQSDTGTLTQEEASEVQDRIVRRLEEELDGQLRA
jgi:phenylalanyl-tRNA synthetase beta chain